MQNDLEITSKSEFWNRSVRNWSKTLTSVMSGPTYSWLNSSRNTQGKIYRTYLGKNRIIYIYIYLYIYIFIYIYTYIYIYIYGNRISEGLHPRSLVVGVTGGHYFDFKGHFIDIIESLLFPANPIWVIWWKCSFFMGLSLWDVENQISGWTMIHFGGGNVSGHVKCDFFIIINASIICIYNMYL